MKKILALILTFAMLFCLAACKDKEDTKKENEENGGNKDEKTTYTVTVVDDEGNPVAGASVSFCPKGSSEIPFPTDAQGRVEYKSAKEMTAKLTEAPAGYEFDKVGQSLGFDANGNLTITLTKLAPFVIKVVDQDGNAIAGVRVQMCDAGGSCRIPVTTGADGTASYPFEDGDFHAQLTALPEGYSVEDVGAYYDFVDGVATITLTKN